MDVPPKNSADHRVASLLLPASFKLLTADAASLPKIILAPRARQMVATRLLKANQIPQDCFIILLLLRHVHKLWCTCLKISYIFGSVHVFTLVNVCVYQ